MRTIEEKRASVRKSLAERRERLMKAGLCRDCGMQPVSKTAARRPNGKPNSRRKETLCDQCKQDRRERAAAKKAA
jgi:hypothetical protein